MSDVARTPAPASRVRVLAIDPSIVNLGWAVLDYDPAAQRIHHVAHGLLVGDKLFKEHKGLHPVFGKTYIRLYAFHDRLGELIDRYQPNYAVSESAFAQAGRVTAYGTLVLVIHTMERACHRLMNAPLWTISPSESKKAITRNAHADKPLMREGLLAHPGLVCDPDAVTVFAAATPDEIDAVCHGCAFIATMLPYLLAGQPLPGKDKKKK